MRWCRAVFSLFLILPLSAAVTWYLDDPVESIQGAYKAVETSSSENPAMLGTVWNFDDDFSVIAWPPKYCHAVHICFVESTKVAGELFQIEANMCEEQYVKFYPHIGRVDIKTSPSAQTITKSNQQNAVKFETFGKPEEYKIIVADQSYEKESLWENRKTEEVTINLAGKMILLLTNSRFCFAHVSQPSRISKFVNLLDPSTYHDPSKLPDVLTSQTKPTGHPSIFTPPVVKSAKTVDLLPVIRKSNVSDTSKMRRKAQCTSFFSTSAQSTALSTIAVDSWQVLIENTVANEREESFVIGLKECSWLRLWVSPYGTDMTAYKNQMKLTDTIDFFFDQQFMVGPDDNEARPMYGNSRQVGSIKIRRFRRPSKTAHSVIEVSYGRDRGPDTPFKEYFDMPSMYEAQFSLNIIRSPRCEATYVTSAMLMNLQSDSKPPTNVLKFKKCKRYILN